MRVLYVLGCAVIAQGALSAPALAADTKTYPGMACVPQVPGGTVLEGTGAISSTLTTSSALFCPVIDESSTTVRAVIRVTDQHATQDITCGLRSRNLDGGSEGFSSAASSGLNSVVQSLSLAEIPRGAYQFIACTIPSVDQGRRSGITTYRVFHN